MADSVRVVKVADGLGFGEGPISFAASKIDIDEGVLEAVEALIGSPGILVPVDDDNDKSVSDDGCGDGRPVAKVMRGNAPLKRSLHRAKVFGGGATMGAAMLIGTNQAQDKTLLMLFDEAMRLLTDKGLDFGAHTDDHASGPKSGCGAIDNAPNIIRQALRYREAISQAISALGIATTDLNDVFMHFQAYAAQAATDADYSGQAVMGHIKQHDKVIKQLAGGHREMYIVLNLTPGMTINQEAVRQESHEQVQVFGVDVWRLQELASHFGPEVRQRQAFLSELVYTLATAAVLTAGDLPVYVVQPA